MKLAFPVRIPQSGAPSLAATGAALWMLASATPAATYQWTGSTNSDFTNPANWVEIDWSEWQNYVFGPDATTGAVSLNQLKGTGSFSLISGLGSDVTISGPNPLVMAIGHGTPEATITIDPDSRDLTVNTDYWSQTTVTWNIGAGRTFTLNGSVANWLAVPNIVKKGSGTAVLGAASSFTGITVLEGGVLNAASFADNGTNSGIGAGTGDTDVNRIGLLFRGGTLQYTGSSAQSTNRQIRLSTLGGGGSIDASGSNNSATLNFTHSAANTNLFENGGTRTLTLTGSNTGNNTFAIPLTDQDPNVGRTSLIKNGPGTWLLSGTSSYTGTTEITLGMLVATSNTALGAGGLSAITLTNIRDGGTLALQGGVTLNEHFHSWGDGVDGLGTVRSLSGNNALTLVDGNGNGGLAIDSHITVGVDADTLTASGFYHDSGSYGITKVGNGTLVLTDISRYTGNTIVSEGTLELADDARLKFVVSDVNSNSITGTGNATFKGDFTIDTSAVSGINGGMWTLVDRASLTGESFDDITFTVIGFDDANNDGIWTMTDAKGDWSFSEETGELTLDVGTDYDDWATANGVTGTETDDDDSDGLTNHEEYAFGLNPTSGSSVNPITIPLDKASGAFSYTRRDRSKTDLAYSVWFSTNLVTWTEDIDAVESLPVLNGEVETVEVTLSSLPGDPLPAKLFIQIRAN